MDLGCVYGDVGRYVGSRYLLLIWRVAERGEGVIRHLLGI